VELIHTCMLLHCTTLQTERLSVGVGLLSTKLAGLGFLFLNSTLKNMRSCGLEWQKACWKDRLQENEGRGRRLCCPIWASVIFYQYPCLAPWWWLQERPKYV